MVVERELEEPELQFDLQVIHSEVSFLVMQLQLLLNMMEWLHMIIVLRRCVLAPTLFKEFL